MTVLKPTLRRRPTGSAQMRADRTGANDYFAVRLRVAGECPSPCVKGRGQSERWAQSRGGRPGSAAKVSLMPTVDPVREAPRLGIDGRDARVTRRGEKPSMIAARRNCTGRCRRKFPPGSGPDSAGNDVVVFFNAIHASSGRHPSLYRFAGTVRHGGRPTSRDRNRAHGPFRLPGHRQARREDTISVGSDVRDVWVSRHASARPRVRTRGPTAGKYDFRRRRTPSRPRLRMTP